MKWSSSEEVKAIFERLVIWYTLDEIAYLMGRTKVSVSRKMKQVGVACLWRKNGARYWTTEERKALLYSAGDTSQERVGKALGRSRNSVSWMSRRLGIRWDQGRGMNLSDVAKLAGCSITYASTKAKKLWLPVNRPARGNGIGRRWNFDAEQAASLMQTIRPGRVYQVHEWFSERS